MKIVYVIGCVLTFLMCNAARALAQKADSLGPFVIPNIETWAMHSSVIKDDFTIYVLKTPGYDTSKAKVPVLYMTDGDWNMTVAMNCFNMLRQDYITHEPLIVGIGYGKGENKRVRDLDPAKGGPAFLQFIEKEVMPFVEAHYRITEEKGIYGYSLGGMFTTYVLFNRPDLFQKVFIGAPGNNGYELMPAARAYFSKHSDLKNQVYLGVGSYELQVVRNIDSFTTYLTSKKLPRLDVRADIAPDANHGSGLSQVMENGMAFAYCEKHRQVKIDPATLPRFTGSYVYYENGKASEQANIFIKEGHLFLRWENPRAIAEELLPFGANRFFIPSNERFSYEFSNENNKPVLLITIAGDQTYRFLKK